MQLGSDESTERFRSELRGDRFVVNGQKIWTSGAPHARSFSNTIASGTSEI